MTSAEAVIDPPESIEIGGKRFVLLLSSEQIRREVERIATQLMAAYGDTIPVMVCVLNGASLFHADLIRAMRVPLVVDFVRVSSYGDSMSSSGTIIFTAESGTLVAGRNVIIVEDIVDTGRTVERLRRYFHEKGAASVKVAALLHKPGGAAPPEFAAFEIPDRFVVGFGLDYQQQGRNLPAVYALDEA